MNYERKVFAYKRYFLDFYEVQTKEVQKKIEWTLKLVETNEIIPSKYFKHIEGTNGLYEIRIEQSSNIYRIFSFLDSGKLIILGNAFQKKSNKTPKKEIEKALKIMQDYYSEK